MTIRNKKSGRIVYFDVITGRGLGSQGHAILFPNVKKYLENL